MVESLANYQSLLRLRDGSRVVLRPLTPEDKDAIVNLISKAPREEVFLLGDEVASKGAIRQWVDQINPRQLFSLVAVISDEIVGLANLYRSSGLTHHVGRLRIFLAKEHRGKGLGSAMLREAIQLAKRWGLLQLAAELLAEQEAWIALFERLGFQPQARLKDYFMTSDRKTHDVVLLTLRLDNAD